MTAPGEPGADRGSDRRLAGRTVLVV
ncbi:MAG: hypothetical protein JWM05_949, partial [Acidimicrobiales bacterium]|nr:hypothetical protein [Acidimicrobiales bacterium]